MPKIVINHSVEDVERWLKYKAERVAAHTARARNLRGWWRSGSVHVPRGMASGTRAGAEVAQRGLPRQGGRTTGE